MRNSTLQHSGFFSTSQNVSHSITQLNTRSATHTGIGLPTTAGRLPDRVLCALYDTGRVDASIGVCFVHFATGEVSLSTIWDSQTYVRTFHKIAVHEPTEVLLPAASHGKAQGKLHTLLNANVAANVKVTGMDKKWFTSTNGMDVINRVCFEQDRAYLVNELQGHDGALAALSAAFHHINTQTRSPVTYHHWRIKHERLESFVNIDINTWRCLDLTANSLEKNGMSVLKFLNNTVTKMGQRALKTNILQPLTDQESIEERFKSVTELKDNSDLLMNLRSELKASQDLDKLFALLLLTRNQPIVNGSTQKVNDIILVKQAVNMAGTVSKLLESCTSPLLQQIREICQNESLTQVKGLIDESINEDCIWESGALDLKNQQCYAVKAGRNGLLDVSRQVYKVVVDEVLSIIGRLGEEHGLILEQAYNNRRGFYIKVLDHKQLDSPLPDVFVQRSEKKKFIECTTLDLMKCNARLDDTISEILTISNEVVESLTQEVTRFLPVLFMVAEAIGMLDLLQCFAYNASKHNYVCPEFSDSITLKASRHPVLETLIPNFISNDVCCIHDVSRIQVITGTNMSGKSVYLRQLTLISLMAQMGSFVPADYASVKIFECIRARIAVDTSNFNASTFASEMMEMVCILEDVNDKSLVIIDELGRGSSINDAFAISLSISEHLVKTGATVFMSTHFHELSTILGSHQGVIQNHMKTEMLEEDGRIRMNYKLTNGVTEARRYGIKIARKFFSKDTIKRAEEISRALQGASDADTSREETLQAKKDKRYINLVAVLQYVSNDPNLNASLLCDIQDEFLD